MMKDCAQAGAGDSGPLPSFNITPATRPLAAPKHDVPAGILSSSGHPFILLLAGLLVCRLKKAALAAWTRHAF